MRAVDELPVEDADVLELLADATGALVLPALAELEAADEPALGCDGAGAALGVLVVEPASGSMYC